MCSSSTHLNTRVNVLQWFWLDHCYTCSSGDGLVAAAPSAPPLLLCPCPVFPVCSEERDRFLLERCRKRATSPRVTFEIKKRKDLGQCFVGRLNKWVRWLSYLEVSKGTVAVFGQTHRRGGGRLGGQLLLLLGGHRFNTTFSGQFSSRGRWDRWALTCLRWRVFNR